MERQRLLLPAAAAAATFVIHLAANPHYGFFRDELYFIICGRHPQWGYVDQPPVIPLLAAGSQIFGISLVALRAISALFAAASVFVTCRLVQEFGGAAFAQILAAIAVALAPVLANFGVLVAPDTVGMWAWPLVVLYLVRLQRGANPRWWLAAGAVAGVALESKYSAAFFLLAAAIGILSTRERKMLRTPWFAAGVAVALAIALPNFSWQALHGFPMIELLRNGQQGKNVTLDPATFVLQQIFITNPVLAPIWIAGLAWALWARALRWIGLGYLALLAMMIALHAKNYYACDAYPAMFALGATAIELWTQRVCALRPVAAVAAALAGAALAPLVLPVLPVRQFITYYDALATILPIASTASEHHKQAALPQTYADMHGWPQLAQTVARVYDSLPPAQRARAVIVASNYGEAAAIEFFGRGAAPVISGHNQYFLWGTRGASGDVVIDVHGDCGSSMRLFRESRRAATFSSPYVMPYEQDMPIMVCRGIKKPLAQIWPLVRNYN
ncbi:MAG TPA: glycosyltransferase family 39 protein [Candidatus Baltobacteraceae bacterium]|nr:glycosyltransferase family 39 protein [Candidatus Baltobacteraceae bacterium]